MLTYYVFIFQRELVCTLLGLSSIDVFYENLKNKVSDKIGEEKLAAIENMGLLSETPINKMDTPLDTLSYFLAEKLVLGKHLLYSCIHINIVYAKH